MERRGHRRVCPPERRGQTHLRALHREDGRHPHLHPVRPQGLQHDQGGSRPNGFLRCHRGWIHSGLDR